MKCLPFVAAWVMTASCLAGAATAGEDAEKMNDPIRIFDAGKGYGPVANLVTLVFPQEEKVFDFCVIEKDSGYEAVFSRVDLSEKGSVPKAGLWWCRAKTPSARISDWSEPVRVSGPGPWKPCLRYGETAPDKMLIFCDGAYPNTSGAGIPMHFTLDSLEANRPE